MQSLFRFKVPRTHYQSDAFILWCFDERFNSYEYRHPLVQPFYWLLYAIGFEEFNPEPSLLRAYVRHMGIKHPDVVTWGGGGKALATGDEKAIADVLIGQMQLSERLHRAKTIHVVVAHADCGGWGGESEFHHDQAAEDAHHEFVTRRGVRAIARIFPGKPIFGIYPRFDGVHLVDQHVPLPEGKAA